MQNLVLGERYKATCIGFSMPLEKFESNEGSGAVLLFFINNINRQSFNVLSFFVYLFVCGFLSFVCLCAIIAKKSSRKKVASK